MAITHRRSSDTSSPLTLIAAFGSVYLIWGSTYLAIQYAIETLPPFLMLGSRFLAAGVVMYAWLRWRGAARPTGRQWSNSFLIGGLLLAIGTGSVTWGIQFIPSGLSALLVATVPLWMVMLDWLWQRSGRPRAMVFVGLVIGLAGIAILFDPLRLIGTHKVDAAGAVAVQLGALAWSVGSIYSRKADLPASPFLSSAMQMLTGGLLLMVVALLYGEGGQFELSAVSLTSFFAWSYLVFFGAFIAFSAYVWLLQHVAPARVSTYAYVNPAVAVFLGWLIADEPFGLRMLLATVLLLSAVVLINTFHRRKSLEKKARPALSFEEDRPWSFRSYRRPPLRWKKPETP